MALAIAVLGVFLVTLALLRHSAASTSAAQRTRIAHRSEPVPSAFDSAHDEEVTVLLSAADLHDLQPQLGAAQQRESADAMAGDTALSASLLDAIVEVNQADVAQTLTTRTEWPDASPLAQEGQLNVRVSYEPEATERELSPSVAPIYLVAGGDSDRGHRRKKNEDNFLFSSERGLFVVADGMGGYAGGSVASGLTVETLRRAFEQLEVEDAAPSHSSMPKSAHALASAVQRANQLVFDLAKSRPELAQMGTTLVALRFALREQRLYLVHAGDSRCYRLRRSELRQLTKDHVMAQLGVQGRQASHLFNAIGIEPDASLDLLVDKPVAGDIYLLCSDGLSKMVSDEVIREVLLAEDDPESAVYTLIEHANDAGGRDNVTVVLAKVMAGLSGATAAESWSANL